MTINETQAQTLKKIGVLLNWPAFTHGNYMSQQVEFDDLSFYILENNDQKCLPGSFKSLFQF